MTPVKSLTRGLDILTAIASRPRRSFDELAAATRIPRSSLYRFLSTLERRGFVRIDAASKGYLPGPVLYHLGEIENELDDVRQTLRARMPKIVDRIGESVYLYVRVGTDRVCIEAVESRQEPIKHVVTLGSKFPLYAGASGKVILAFVPDREREQVLNEMTLKNVGPRTITSRRALERELVRIREQGYAYSEEELSAGAWALAVPLHQAAGACDASLAVAGPLFRFNRDQIAEYARHLRRVAWAVSAGGVAAAQRRQRSREEGLDRAVTRRRAGRAGALP